jgi:formylglycine-generating enzyme required for sulfatase activity
MKRTTLLSALTIATLFLATVAVNKQTKFYLYPKDGNAIEFNMVGNVFEYNIADVDSITFTPPESNLDFEPEMVSVDGGTFMMGSPAGVGDSEERQQHQVTVSSFNIGKYEVTQGQLEAVMDSNPSYFKTGDNYPVEQVSWDDIVGTSGAYTEIKGIRYYENGFIYKLNQLTGKNYRLPTEAEWEYAARGGNKSKGYIYSGSNNVGDVAWYGGDSGSRTQEVGTKQANELGIYDMSGNVWEWCSDWYGSYTADAQTNPTGPAGGSRRVGRGGGWNGNGSPGYRDDNVGFRVVLP